jgi:hypothetical protein
MLMECYFVLFSFLVLIFGRLADAFQSRSENRIDLEFMSRNWQGKKKMRSEC